MTLPPNLRNIERPRLREKVDEMNKILTFIETKVRTQTNELLLAVGRVVGKRLVLNNVKGDLKWNYGGNEGLTTRSRI